VGKSEAGHVKQGGGFGNLADRKPTFDDKSSQKSGRGGCRNRGGKDRRARQRQVRIDTDDVIGEALVEAYRGETPVRRTEARR